MLEAQRTDVLIKMASIKMIYVHQTVAATSEEQLQPMAGDKGNISTQCVLTNEALALGKGLTEGSMFSCNCGNKYVTI